jgi:hypothetical protein
MKAEFLRDENNNVWLSNVRDVHYRLGEVKSIFQFDAK